MSTVLFNVRDADLLYSFPRPPADLTLIVRLFMFVNRAGPPTYGELTSCLTKALSVGIIREHNGMFVVEKEWYDRIHKADETARNEIESMLEFEEDFVKVPFLGKPTATTLLSEDEYRLIIASLRRKKACP